MLFLVSFLWQLTASFAFLLAILTPNWVSFTKSGQTNVERGIFYVCDALKGATANNKTTLCVSIIDQKSSVDRDKWLYGKTDLDCFLFF